MKTQSVLECGGKRSATPLSHGKDVQPLLTAPRPKAEPPLRFVTAVQKLARVCIGLFCFILLTFDFCLRASGQQYSIDWHKISGGGGTSSGGNYSISGTIGQHDASGAMNGGNYLLTGGFWSLISVVPTPGAPTLYIRRSGATVTIYWQEGSGWSLQQNNDLNTPTGWSGSDGVNTSDGTNHLYLVSFSGNLFFRLRKE